MNKEIIPACMPKRFEDITETAESVVHFVDTIQLDIMDSKYVPEKTWPFFHKEDFDLIGLVNEEKGFPFWENLNYELDLMVERPELSLDKWLHVGASRIIFHYKSVGDWSLIRDIDYSIRNFIKLGVAVTIYDDLNDIYTLIDEEIVDFVQVMGISQIGYMGEPFNEKCLLFIRELRNKYPELIISIDGGVSEYTIPLLCKAGVNRLVSGSSIFSHGIIEENIEYLKSIANNVPVDF